MNSDKTNVDELVISDASGVWMVSSASETVYYVDADACLLLRVPGPHSSRGPGDGRWVPIVSVTGASRRDEGVLRVGDRHRYLYDHDPNASDYGWWIQRRVTSIERLDEDAVAMLPRSRGGAE